ncbi:MAG: acetate/propionate family kinase, partial [bacterium]
MSILVINSGSTSIKYKLFAEDESEIKSGCVGIADNYSSALKMVFRNAGDLSDLTAVGHRVVHGGHEFSKPIAVNQDNFFALEKFNDLAPLHNPYNLVGIKESLEYLPQIKQVAVFDTAFYSGLPETAKLYALPLEISEKYKIYRYGFHGISHQYAMLESAKTLKIEVRKINLITCHLGGGWSITAIKNGKPIDTSMGMTPLEGLAMMTRVGDIDPGIIFKLLKEMPAENLYDLLNKQSGIKGLSGVDDFKELLRLVSSGNKRANLAFDIAIGRLVKYIGAYWTQLEGNVHAIVFTGAIGAGNPMTRNQVMKKIKCLGKLPMLAVETGEELM